MEPNVTVEHLHQAPDLSMIGMFTQADFVVQVVMVMLLFASFWCWSIIFSKVIKLKKLRIEADVFEEAFWSGGSIEALYDRVRNTESDPITSTFVAAMKELKRGTKNAVLKSDTVKTSLFQRIERIMQNTADREMEGVGSHMGFLASVGSVAPFIGLFGTVWGIMNSFQGIAASQSTNLAVVAPGIAEALLATALGLLAAIPAVLGYNKLSHDINTYQSRLENFTNEFGNMISRQMNEGDL